MPLRSKRQRRYEILHRAGFLKGEAITLSKVPFKVPYMDEIVKRRYSLLEESRRLGRTEAEYKRSIQEMYKAGGHIKRSRIGRRLLDVWSFFRGFEARYKEKHPEYQSPWVKRQYRFRDFVRKVERADIMGYYKRRR